MISRAVDDGGAGLRNPQRRARFETVGGHPRSPAMKPCALALLLPIPTPQVAGQGPQPVEAFALGISVLHLGEESAYLITSGVDETLVSRLVRPETMAVLHEFTGRDSERWFLGAQSVGDLDGDGSDEVASRWMFRIESGDRLGTSTVLHSGPAWDPFREYPCSGFLPIADLDGKDGREVAVRVLLPSLGQGTSASMLRIVTPATGTTRVERRIEHAPGWAEMCWVAGDIDGEPGGIVVSGHEPYSTGCLALLSPIDLNELWSVPLDLSGAGWPSLVGLEDLDGDGVTDFGFAFHRLDGGETVLHVLSGRNGDSLYRISDDDIGATDDDRSWGTGFCSSLVSLEDVDGDGVPDLAMGADGLSLSHGGLFTFSGASGKLLYSVPVPELADYFGASITRVPDRDVDGVSELLVGTTAGRGLTRDPRVYLISGRAGEFLGSYCRADLVYH